MSTFDRFTVSRARVRILLACFGAAVAAGLVVGMARSADPHGSVQPAVPPQPAAAAEVVQPGTLPDTDSAPPAEEAPPGEAPSGSFPTLNDADAVDAQQAAADFAAAYATYSYDDPPSAAVERLRELVTTEFAADLARASGAIAGREELAERQQRSAGSAFTVHMGSVADGHVDVLVVVRQELTWTDGAETRWPTYQVRVVRTDAGWRVSRLLR